MAKKQLTQKEEELMAGLISGHGLYPTQNDIIEHLGQEGALHLLLRVESWLGELRTEANDMTESASKESDV